MVNNDFDKSFKTLLQELEESYALVQYVNENGVADIPEPMTSIAKKLFSVSTI